jgi:hypothetical protein
MFDASIKTHAPYTKLIAIANIAQSQRLSSSKAVTLFIFCFAIPNLT